MIRSHAILAFLTLVSCLWLGLVAASDGISSITLGGAFSVAVFEDGIVKAWGQGGSLGLGDEKDYGNVPEDMDMLPYVPLGTHVAVRKASAAAHGWHTCVVTDTDAIKCWGANWSGQLGLGDNLPRGTGIPGGRMGDDLPFVDLGHGTSAATVACGGHGSCAILNDGRLKCWGKNWFGELGLGDALSRGAEPGQMGDALPAVNLGSGRSAARISLGYSHACAVLDDGAVKCWGLNRSGQLGLGDTVNRGGGDSDMGDNLPAVDLGAGETAVDVACGEYHSCALLQGGRVKCWGSNGRGQLGLGDVVGRGMVEGDMGDALPYVDLGTGAAAREIVASGRRTCALLENGSLKCWGSNGDTLGIGLPGSGTHQTKPVGNSAGQMGDALPAVDLGTGAGAEVVTVAVGNLHSCAILRSGSVKCWGHNERGQLGLGDTVFRGRSPKDMGDALPAVSLRAPKVMVKVEPASAVQPSAPEEAAAEEPHDVEAAAEEPHDVEAAAAKLHDLEAAAAKLHEAEAAAEKLHNIEAAAAELHDVEAGGAAEEPHDVEAGAAERSDGADGTQESEQPREPGEVGPPSNASTRAGTGSLMGVIALAAAAAVVLVGV